MFIQDTNFKPNLTVNLTLHNSITTYLLELNHLLYNSIKVNNKNPILALIHRAITTKTNKKIVPIIRSNTIQELKLNSHINISTKQNSSFITMSHQI